MSEERIQKIKWTTLTGAAIAMAGILVLQLIARALIGSATSGFAFDQLEITSLMKAMIIFGLVGATSGAIGGMFTEIKEKPRPTRVKREGDEEEEEEDEAARETMAKLGIAEERERERERKRRAE